LTEIHGVYIGTWRERADIEEIKERIAIIKSRQNIQQDIDRLIVNATIKKPTQTIAELEAYIDDYIDRNRIAKDEGNS
jgi:hypothetical protein